jgi:iron(III) transport system permease protein
LWLPAVSIALAVLLPLLYLVIRALDARQGLLAEVFNNRNLQVMANSLGLATAVVIGASLIGIPLAWLTVRTDLPLARLWALLAALPLVVPSYIGAYLMVSALGPRGLIQSGLEVLFGIERIPSIYGFPGAALVLILLTYPYIFLSVRSALSGLDPRVEEAAQMFGHGQWASFRKVVLPQLRPALVAGGLLVVLYTLRDFGAVSILRFDTFTRVLYVQYQSLLDRSGAAALALLLVLVTGLILFGERRLHRTHSYYSMNGSGSHVRARVALGRWSWPALIFCGSVVTMALLLPAGVLFYWLVRGLQAGESLSLLVIPTLNSVSAAGLAGAATLVAALPIAIWNTRYGSKVSGTIERLSYLGFALPGIVIALALVFFGANYLPGLYQSLPLLVFAYLILFLPQAIGSISTTLGQIHPHFEEAGRGLGRSPAAVFRTITLPLLRPGMITGALLVFLTVMKELPATLILSPIGFGTLATAVWGAVEEAFFAQAAAPALLLILVTSVPMAILVIWRRL